MERQSRLIVAPNWVGDTVMAIPFVRAIHRAHPEDRLVFMARPGPAAILRALGFGPVIPRRSTVLRDVLALRGQRLSEAWLLPNSNRMALTTFFAGIPERIGFARDYRAGFLTRKLSPPARAGHQLRDYDALLRLRGVEPDSDPPRLPIGSAASTRARSELEQAGLAGERPLILLAPGAAFGWTKRWPADKFARLGDRLIEKKFAVAITVGPGEERLAQRIAAAMRRPCVSLGQDLDTVELAALFAHAVVVVANDSGPMHLAAAVGTPIVAFFGPTDSRRTAPVGIASRVLDRRVFCSPCFLRECPYGHECLRNITVAMALEAVEMLVGSGRPAARPEEFAEPIDDLRDVDPGSPRSERRAASGAQ